jgi:predicted Rossmann fold nucleotide-binding protein DprA/Smf involved in DNA uptake
MTSKMDLVDIGCNNSGYLFALKKYLNDSVPQSITVLGNPNILGNRAIALFCSQKCPGELILKVYDLAQVLRHAGITVIGGFHSPMEKECLTLLLRGTQPVIVCPARSINKMRIRAEYKKPLEKGRLLFLSPFDKNQHRPTVKTSHYRNRFAAALCAVVFVAYAGPFSKTEELCREIISWQKPLYSFDSDYNKNLIEMGAQPVNMDNVSEWAKLLDGNADKKRGDDK